MAAESGKNSSLEDVEELCASDGGGCAEIQREKINAGISGSRVPLLAEGRRSQSGLVLYPFMFLGASDKHTDVVESRLRKAAQEAE